MTARGKRYAKSLVINNVALLKGANQRLEQFACDLRTCFIVKNDLYFTSLAKRRGLKCVLIQHKGF